MTSDSVLVELFTKFSMKGQPFTYTQLHVLVHENKVMIPHFTYCWN